MDIEPSHIPTYNLIKQQYQSHLLLLLIKTNVC